MAGKGDRTDVNELVEIEEGLLTEMREEYRKRLERRLQEKADVCGSAGPDGILLKKKTCSHLPEKLLRKR